MNLTETNFLAENLIVVTVVILLIFLVCYFFSKIYVQQKELLDDSIELYFLDSFLTNAECDHIVEMANDKFIESKTIGDDNSDIINDHRTSSSFYVQQNDPVAISILDKVNNFMKSNINFSTNWKSKTEFLQVVKYEPNQYFKQHHDYFNKKYLAGKVGGNQREFTIFVYLNNVESGGETHFVNLHKKIKPKKGSALFWRNCNSAQKCLEHSLHEGLPPQTGRKYGLNIWIRFLPIH